MIIIYRTFLILVFSSIILHAQKPDSTSIHLLIESYLEDATIENSNEQIYDLVEQLLAEPLDINKASAEDLLTIPFIDITTAAGIIEYRNNSGRIFSLDELNMITDIPKETINILKAFLFVENKSKIEKSINNILAESGEHRILKLSLRSRLIKDIQDRRGFKENRYSGSNLKTYNRLQVSYNNVRFGILAEKDAGEVSHNDFLSYHFEAKNIGFLDRIVLGDYLIEFGQGLAVWGPYSFSKGADATGPIIRKNRNIISYTSTDENKFFRGMAAGITLGPIGFAAFYSNKKIDASIDTDSREITSVVSNGFHRSESEILNKSSVNEKVYGATINIRLLNEAAINFLYLNSEFSLPHQPGSFRDLSGSIFNFYSTSYNTIIDNLFLSGEIAYDGKSAAWINNLQYSIDRRVALLASVRSYDKSFKSLYSNGFGESSNTQNEYGFYLGVRWKSNYGLINIYFDQFKFPSATFSNPLPGVGNEILINYNNKFTSKLNLTLRYKIENKEITGEQDGFKIQLNRQKQNARMDFKMSLNKRLKFRTRFEYVFVRRPQLGNHESGFLTFQDVQYRPSNNLSVYSRIIFFQTDSYNSRIYEFENDLRGVMTNTPLFGKGMKWYLIIKYSFLQMFTLSFKYSELFKPEEKTLGSGYSEISGNFDNRISLQVELNY